MPRRRHHLLLALAAMIGAMSGMTLAASAQTVATLSAPAMPAVPPAAVVRPTDPVKLAAFNVLDTHCSRCHQVDRLVGRSKPAKGFGNILDMDAIAQNPKYVTPGDADRSLIYHQIIRQEMPSDVFQDGDLDHPAPTDDDLKALRAWISSLKAPPKTEPAKPVVVASLETPVPPVLPPVAVLPPDSPQLKDNGELVAKIQANLRRIGCYGGDVTSIADDATNVAIARYNDTQGRGNQAVPMTPDLLEELKGQDGQICGTRPVIAALPPADEKLPPVATPAPVEPPAAKLEPPRPAPLAKPVPPKKTETATLEEEAKPARNPPSAPAKPRSVPQAERKAAAPAKTAPHKVARDVPLRQPPVTRQASRAGGYRQAQRSVGGGGGGGGSSLGGGGGGGGGGGNMSGLNGI